MKRPVLPWMAGPLLLGLGMASSAWAAPDPATSAELSRLAAEQRALEQRFAVAERGCADVFAVNACVERVRAERRAALAPLREAELRLEQAERQRRADERRAAIARKQQALPPAQPPASAASAPGR